MDEAGDGSCSLSGVAAAMCQLQRGRLGLCAPWSWWEPGTGGSPTPLQVGGAGAPPSWAQLQPPISSCGPRHPCTLRGLKSPLYTTGSKVPAPAAWPLPAPDPCSNCGTKLHLSPEAVTTQLGVHVFGVVLTCQPPTTSPPSRIWAPMGMGGRPRWVWGQLGTGLKVHHDANSLGAMDTVDGRLMVAGNRWAKWDGCPVKPHLQAKDNLKPGSWATCSTDWSENLRCFILGLPRASQGPISTHFLPSDAHKNPRLSQTQGR